MLKADKLLELADFIEKMEQGDYNVGIPGFDMHVWNEEVYCDYDAPEETCGTAACIGGTAQALFNLPSSEEVFDTLSDREGSDYGTLHRLFFPIAGDRLGWDATPSEAAMVIRHLVETGKVDWRIIREPVVNRDADLDRFADDGGRAGAT